MEGLPDYLGEEVYVDKIKNRQDTKRKIEEIFKLFHLEVEFDVHDEEAFLIQNGRKLEMTRNGNYYYLDFPNGSINLRLSE